MAKYSDNLGKSRVAPYYPGEHWADRHKRRLKVNRLMEETVRNWLDLYGATLIVTKGGRHWRIQKGRKVAEWLPETATLVIQGSKNQGIKCYDHTQLMKALKQRWKLKGIVGVMR